MTNGGQKWSSVAAGVAALGFLVGGAGAVGFAFAFWTSLDTQWKGALPAAGLAGIALGLVLWSHRLMPSEEASESYGSPASSPEEREAFRRELAEVGGEMGRRTFLGLLFAGGVSLLGLSSVLLVRSLGPAPAEALRRSGWGAGARLVTADGRAVKAGDLEENTFVTVFPEGDAGSADGQAVLIRVPAGTLDLPAGRDGWAPDGHVAYSKLCTHAGCAVGEYDASSNVLVCPCHQSAFNVLQGARPVGGPADRALPQLPLSTDAEGYLVARGDFPEPVGPSFWRMS